MIQLTTVVSGDTQGGLRTPLEPKDPMLQSNKLEVLQKGQTKKTQSYKVPVSSGVHTDNHNFSQELKRESEYVSTGCTSIQTKHVLEQSTFYFHSPCLYLQSPDMFVSRIFPVILCSLCVFVQGPCRREMESIIKIFKISSVLNARGFRIPNCDQKGFYKKKQVITFYPSALTSLLQVLFI